MGGFRWVCSGTLAALAACSAQPLARAQFVAPVNSLSFEDTGTLEGAEPGYMRIRDSKTELWLLKLTEDTKTSVEGEAEVDYLRPGLSVQFDGKIDKKGLLQKAIDEIEILGGQGKVQLGLFAAGEGADDSKPIRNPGPGSYRIRGKLASYSYKDGELVVAVGGRKIAGRLAEEVTIKFTSDDPSIAQPGDAVKVKLWYYENSKPMPGMNQPGKGVAEEITITLDKPLSATGKKARAVERPAKAPAKSAKTGR